MGGLNIREPGAAERGCFMADWHAVQSRFVDHPKGAVREADELVSSLLRARGYPVADFDRRAEDISVNHPRLAEYYRSAHVLSALTYYRSGAGLRSRWRILWLQSLGLSRGWRV